MSEQKMKSLNEIRNSPKEMLTPADVAPYFGCDPYSINLQAKEDPSKLGVPCIVIGTRVKFPKEGFVNYCEAKYMLNDPRDTPV